MNMVSNEHSRRWTAYCDEQSKLWTELHPTIQLNNTLQLGHADVRGGKYCQYYHGSILPFVFAAIKLEI